ncbi:ankyrin repeat domain-containing protein [Chamaesiphon sp. VAR_48_metabat_403]|uniref:ankyrin repeat domain-containing protein n=1 Tax=Chamaesiphon sp. VAR_48_metabat_403 TaxID=2964700 RepID=UPI00286DFC3D|nr:ankyrin repeat domain-containing protein [Chamaesiphon sp. VAR_48_metabat_403]
MIDQNGMRDGKIHGAARFGDLTKLKNLISIDRSLVQANGWHGTKPLHYAAQSGSLECVKFLVANGADVNAKSIVNKTTAILEASTEEIALFLVEKGARVDIMDSSGRVPLDSAIQRKHVEVVRYLIDCGVDVNYLSGSGFNTMMQWALTEIFRDKEQSGYSEIVEISRQIVEMLLKAGGDPNQRNRSGTTVLQVAVGMRYKSIIELLLNYGADPCIRDAWGNSCFDLTGDESILALLAPYKANLVEIYKKQDDLETLIERLIASGESTRDEFMPCTEKEIINLEISHDVKLPQEYKKFLRVMGHYDGSFLRWSAFMESFDDDLGKHFFEFHEPIKHPENFFVFASQFSGDPSLGFFADGLNDDPEIYNIDRDGNIEKWYDSLWEFIQEVVEYYEYSHNPQQFMKQFDERWLSKKH